MCLAVPGKIITIKNSIATVDYGIEKRKGRLISQSFNVGDYVLVQGGVVVERVDKKEAIQALSLYRKSMK